tara:strand:- start:1976 stop:3796 length:1821 start_codon:yes stop_codon:yes gene_type:complete
MNKLKVNTLLIEDNSEHIELITDLLSESKLSQIFVEVARNFKEAYQLISSNTYDLILADLSLPDSSYKKTIKELKKVVTNAPIVVLTSLDDKDTILKMIQEGAQDCIPKNQLNTVILERTIVYSIDRFALAHSISESEKKFRNYFEKSYIGIVVTDLKGDIVDINQSFGNFIGYVREEIIGKNFREITYNEDLKKSNEFVGNLLENDSKSFSIQKRYVTKKGMVVWGNVTVQKMKWEGESEVLLAEIIDITGQKSAQQKLNKANDRLVSILDSMESVVYVADMENYELLFLNKYGRKLFGEIEGKKCWQVMHQGQSGQCNFCTNDKLIPPRGEVGKTFTWEYQNTITGQWFHINDRAITWIDGRIVKLEIATDITNRKEMEENIKASLKEKELLLREIHHRVKNNMQVISSLLHIQSGQIKDKEILAMFNESRNRIKWMSMIHEKLYKSKNLAKINIMDYIKDLANDMLGLYKINANNVVLKLSDEDIYFGIDIAVPFGLLINELLSNCLKYAFPDDRKGEIKIFLRKFIEEGTKNRGDIEIIELILSDNGAGLPDNIDYRNTKSLGMQLVTSLAEKQLGGKIELNQDRGTEFNIRFKDLKEKNII